MTSADSDSASSLPRHISLLPVEPIAQLQDQLEAQTTLDQTFSTVEPYPSSPTAFSDYGSDIDRQSHRSMSISSSSRDYAFENGLRYHKFREGRYAFPNDESEQDREDMKHAMIVNLCGGRLHFSPVGEYAEERNGGQLHNIIDLGTGTGIWCIEMGDEYPSAQILGVDLSPIQPVWVPPNVNFMVDDVESDWLKPENFYDLVHARHVTQAIKDFLRCCNEHTDTSNQEVGSNSKKCTTSPLCFILSLPPDYSLLRFFQFAVQGLASLGTNLDASLSEAASLEKYGFINIRHETLQIPIGTWPKDKILKAVGFVLGGIEDGLQAMAYGPLCRGLGWSRERVDSFLVEVKECLRDTGREVEEGGIRAYLPFHVWCGQKPF